MSALDTDFREWRRRLADARRIRNGLYLAVLREPKSLRIQRLHERAVELEQQVAGVFNDVVAAMKRESEAPHA